MLISLLENVVILKDQDKVEYKGWITSIRTDKLFRDSKGLRCGGYHVVEIIYTTPKGRRVMTMLDEEFFSFITGDEMRTITNEYSIKLSETSVIGLIGD